MPVVSFTIVNESRLPLEVTAIEIDLPMIVTVISPGATSPIFSQPATYKVDARVAKPGPEVHVFNI